MIAALRTQETADGFWSAATLSTVALSVAFGEARAEAKRAPANVNGARQRIVDVCRELGTLSGDSDGKLVGAIAASLGEFARDAFLDEPALEVIAGHLEALRAVVRHAIAGDGGTVGRAIMAGLEASVARHPPAA
jgi:hypothetical protein